MQPSMENKALFEASHIEKTYGSTRALQDVQLTVHAGEIVGLIGENGAGKSTLLKIMAGVERADQGSLTFGGAPYKPKDTLDANRMGIGMVFQEQSMIGSLTVGQNIFLGREAPYKTCGVIRWRQLYQAADRILAEAGVERIHARDKVCDLNFASRQFVEITKVMNIVSGKGNRQGLILLDEPTSVLNDKQVELLFGLARRLKEQGFGVVFVSHRLDEVISLCDRVYIFKDGRNSGCFKQSEITEEVLYKGMVGHATSREYYKISDQVKPSDEVVMEVKNLRKRGVFKHVSFSLHKGEILGLCGVEGSGIEDVVAVIGGDEKADGGEMLINQKEEKFHLPADALKAGVLMIPKERREEGMIGALSLSENIVIGNFRSAQKKGFVLKRRQKRLAQTWIERLSIRCPGPDAPMRQLSGGNAQKVVFARAINSDAKILILNHPTRGVDVGSKEDIYGIIREITQKGKAVILLGDTLDEYIGLSSRIIAMKDGLVKQTFDCSAGNKPKPLDIVQYMM